VGVCISDIIQLTPQQRYLRIAYELMHIGGRRQRSLPGGGGRPISGEDDLYIHITSNVTVLMHIDGLRVTRVLYLGILQLGILYGSYRLRAAPARSAWWRRPGCFRRSSIYLYGLSSG